MRLSRFLAQAGVASRRQAEALIASGGVRVNGAVVSQLGTKVDVNADTVEVGGRRVRPETPIYRVLLKPRACLATLDARQDRPTLARYVRAAEPGLRVVAPLDFPAEGLVLLTTDGELAEAMSRGGGRVPMTYHLKLQGLIRDEDVVRLLRGWKWENRPVRPHTVETIATTGKNSWIEMIVPEIRARALKAAGDVIRHAVLKVSRVRLGGIRFEGLRMGDQRDLKKTEVASLRTRAGLPG